MTGPILAALAGSDCERISGGWWAQPANAASSLAYVLVGLWLLRRALASAPHRELHAAGGLGLVAVGAGSVAYHGPQPGWAGAAHGGSIVALLAVLVVHSGWLLARHRLGVGVAYAAPSLVVAPGLGLAGEDRLVLAALVAAAVVGAALVHRARLAGARELALARRLSSTAAAVMAAALVAYAAGRTSSALCRPDSLLQAHALWHVASAAGIGLALLALAAQTPAARPAAGPPSGGQPFGPPRPLATRSSTAAR